MREPCRHCGSAPISHTGAWIESFLGLLLTAPIHPLLHNPSPFFRVEHSPLVRVFGNFFIETCIQLGLIRIETDIEKAPSERTKAIWREAKKRGVSMEQLVFLGNPLEESRALLPRNAGSKKRSLFYFQSIPIPPWLPDGVGTLTDDKYFFKKTLGAHGFPVPLGEMVRSELGAKKAFALIGAKVIVKPRDGSRARHTSVHLEDEEAVRKAFRIACALSPFVMVEQHIEGGGYRATCVGGVCVAVVRFVRPSVTGDGIHTVSELTQRLNEKNATCGRAPVQETHAWRTALEHQGFTPESVPEVGRVVVCTEHAEVLPNGGFYEDVTEQVPKIRLAEIEKAAALLGLQVIGFDLMSKDLTTLAEPYFFLEGNSLPFIEVHDNHTNGPARNVAASVWDLWGLSDEKDRKED